MSCDNVITVQDLETDKKHSTFYREVITGKAGGTGADIDSATNEVTGQTQATLPKVLSNVGFSPSGFDFTTGGTLTERDKAIFYQADGNWYSWGGTLPKVVPPTSSPASTGGIADNAWNVSTSAFMYRDWEGFTAELLAQGGVPDNGQPDELGNSQRVDAILKLASDAVSRSSYLDISSINLRSKKIVITGDSLSFNAYDFPIPLNPTSYADGDNSPGLMSWSHMLRDKINRSDDNFVHAFDIGACVSNGTGSYRYNFSTATDRYFFPQNGSLLEVNGKLSTDSVRLTIPRNYNDSIVRLNCVNAGANLADRDGIVDVYARNTSGTWVSKGSIRTGGRTGYFGLEPFSYDIVDSFYNDAPILIELRNFRRADGSSPGASGVSLFISSAQSNTTDTFITGRGGYTTEQILSDINRLAVSKSPDLMFLIAGANDRALGVTSSDVISNLDGIFSAVRSANPNIKIVFMSTTRASDVGFNPSDEVSGERMVDWLEKIRLSVVANGVDYFDTYKFTSSIDPSLWRFDNIHFNKSGNKLMLDNVCSRFFPSLIDKYPQLSNPAINFQYWGELTGRARNKINSGWVEVSFSNSTKTYHTTSINDRDGVVFSVARGSDSYDMIVTTNFNINKFNLSISIIAVSSFGAMQPIATTASLLGNSAKFTLFKLGGTAITDAENDGKKYMIFFN